MLIVAVEAELGQGAIDGVRDALQRMETETRKEPGCITYAFSVDVSSPTTLRVFERWESEQALTAHFQTPHMADFRQTLARVQPKSMELKVYQVEKELALPS